MDDAALQSLAQTLARRLRCADEALCLQLLRSLATGNPVEPQQLARQLNSTYDTVTAQFAHMPDIELDTNGNVLAWGLSLLPTAHQFRFNRQTLYTWCALDTFMYTALLQVESQVISRCPITGTSIQLVLNNSHISQLDPLTTVISVVEPTPEVDFDCRRSSFCNHGHFFATSEAAALWQQEHPGTIILSAGDAFRLGQLVITHREAAAQQMQM